MRALDHAIELLYNPRASETPHKLLSLATVHELFKLLPQNKNDPDNIDIRQKLQIVAFGSLFSISFKGGLGLSHSMGMFP
jgi:3-oxoacid CoA-transferase